MVSKLNSDRKAGEGAGQAMTRIYGKIGFAGLWNGLPVRIFMIGTLTAFQWLIYDSFKVYLGVSIFFANRTRSELTSHNSCLRLVATRHFHSALWNTIVTRIEEFSARSLEFKVWHISGRVMLIIIIMIFI